jgi:hypothetical protein
MRRAKVEQEAGGASAGGGCADGRAIDAVRMLDGDGSEKCLFISLVG